MGWVSGAMAASTLGIWAGILLLSRSSADSACTWSLEGICTQQVVSGHGKLCGRPLNKAW